jgi:hypothetical protein
VNAHVDATMDRILEAVSPIFPRPEQGDDDIRAVPG